MKKTLKTIAIISLGIAGGVALVCGGIALNYKLTHKENKDDYGLF